MWHDSGLYSLSNIAPFMICRVHIEKKLPMVTIECSSANTSSNATLMVFVKAKKGLRTNSFISRTPWIVEVCVPLLLLLLLLKYST
jgi:hypothetical protein